MNERIKELLKQAGTDVSGKWIGIDNAEKFAELIVKETLQVARAGVEFGDGMESAVERYFGMKL